MYYYIDDKKGVFMEFNLTDTAKNHIVVVAHRGVSGGNIPCNTTASYDIALKQGADMIEVDVSKSIDGKLFLFHPFMEHAHLNKFLLTSLLPYSLIKKLHYVNYDNTPTQFNLCSFDDFLEEYNDKCFINIDKFWANPKKIYNDIKRHNMLDQIIVKSKPDKKVFDILENLAPDIQYMPIVKNTHSCHDLLKSKNINYIGVEVLFDNENANVASYEFIEKMHKDNVLVWVNSIIYNYRNQLSAGHSDDTALTKSEDLGWGWLVDRGFDIIQTDWPLMLINYLKNSGKYKKQPL